MITSPYLVCLTLVAGASIACSGRQRGAEVVVIARNAADLENAHSLNEALSACGVSPNAHNTSQKVSLGVTLRPQETDEWCWAASAQMSMEFLGTSVQQCEQAKDKFKRDDCCKRVDPCPSPRTGLCVQSSVPDFHRYGYTAEQRDGALGWDELTTELKAGRPVPFTWVTGDYGHMMVAYGFSTETGTREVLIHDPARPCEGFTTRVSYDYYSADTDHAHGIDYHHLRRTKESVTPSPLGPSAPISPPISPIAVPPGTDSAPLFPTLNKAARCAIVSSHKIAAKELGFPPVINPIANVFYETALADALISRRDLRNYVLSPGKPAGLLKATGLHFIPVGVNGQLTSGVMIRKQGSQFGTVQVGNVPLARQLANRLHSAPSGSTIQGLVRVPFLHANFLVARGSSQVSMMLLTDDHRVGLPVGEWRSADIVVARLAALNRIVPGNY